MKRIKVFDEALSRTLADFDETARGFEFREVGPLTDEQAIAQLNYAGLYLVEIKCDPSSSGFESWLADFKARWEHRDYVRQFTPNVKKKRVKFHKELKEWMPIYLGKSQKISGRVLGHLNLELKATTVALKLKARENMDISDFRLSTIEVNVENYDIIVPRMERVQRDKINPILGKQ